MGIDQDYPNALYGELPMLARLLTAIHVACIDAGGAIFGVEYADSELQHFFDVNTHRYFSVKPTGSINTAASTLKKAVLASVEKGELKLAVVKRNLTGELSLLDSWVEADAFDDWCNSRGLSLGESWFELWKDDQEIFSATLETQVVKRRQYEGLNDESDVESLREQFETGGVDALFAEISTLRAKLKRYESKDAAMVERPLSTRERNTLLTIIAALCKDAGHDFTKHAKTAGLIESTASKMGLSIGDTTIEGHLKKIPDALESRMK